MAARVPAARDRGHPVHLYPRTGPGVGLGHLVRNLALAAALRDQGAAPVVHLGGGDPRATELAAEFPVAPWQLPPEESLVVLDGYGLDRDFVDAASARAARLLWFDDRVDAPPSGALVLAAATGSHLDGYPEVPPEALLLGPRFACLRPAIVAARDRRAPAPAKGLFLLGGAPRPAATRVLVEAASALVAEGPLEEALVIGAAPAPGEPPPPGVEMVPFDPAIDERMAEATVAVSSGGQTLLELCYLGVPTVAYQLTADQLHNITGLVATGAILGAGHVEDPGAAASIVARVRDLWRRRDELGPRARQQVDGQGARRAAAALLEPSEAPEVAPLRAATREDRDLLRRWRNDPAVIEASLSGQAVTPEEHEAWLDRRLARPAPDLWVATSPSGLPVGQARLDALEDPGAPEAREVTIAVGVSRRGQGWGAAILRALAALPAAAPLVARVREANTASLRLFECQGYRREKVEDGVVHLRRPEAS